MKGAILQVDGILYVTAPDNVWALDARDGREIWHYFWKTRGGTHIGNRGAAMWRNYLFFETPDNYLVSLDAKTGEERWHVEIADFDQQYFSTPAPIIAGDHVIVGTGNDLDGPGFLQSFDPETGKLQWKFYTVPMNPGDPGLETWPNLDAARYGGGHTWMPGSFDPETRLYIFGTGNPTPAYTGVGRPGDNLFTCSLIAVNVDTGKMAWYYQMSPHDTHDWDAVQAPILIDATRERQAAQARLDGRAKWIFLHRRSRHRRAHRHDALRLTTNWASGLNAKGAPMPDPAKEAIIPGALVSPVEDGTNNWQPAGILAGHRPASTRRSTTRSTCCTSPIPIRAGRWGSVERCALTWASSADSSRPSSPQPGKSPGDGRSESCGGGGNGAACNRGRASVRRRRQRQLRRVRREGGEAALAHGHRHHLQRAANLHARRTAVRAGRDRDDALGVYAELRNLLIVDGQIERCGMLNIEESKCSRKTMRRSPRSSGATSKVARARSRPRHAPRLLP